MIRRVFLKAAALGVLCSPAFAADPLPKLQETPMLAEQVKSGALPAVDKRVPKQPLVVTKFAGGDGPGQPGGQLNMLVASARDTRLMTVYSYTRLIVYDDRVQAAARHPRELRGQGRPRVHLEAARRPQMVGRPALHHRGLPLLLGRHRQQQGAVAVRPVGRADGRRQAAQGRDHRRADDQVTPGTSPTPTSSRARRAPRRSSCSGRRTTSRSSTPSTPRPRRSPRRPRAARARQLGADLPAS